MTLILIKKEFLHVLRAPRTLLFLFAVPVLFLMLYGYAISQDVNTVKVACVVEGSVPDAHETIKKLAFNPVFDYCGQLANVAEGERMMHTNDLNGIVVIRRGDIGLCVDGSNPIVASATTVYLKAALNQTRNVRDDIFCTRMLFNPQLLSAYNFVPGIIGLVIISIFGLLTSSSIVREKVNGTMDVISISPLRLRQLFLAKVLTYFILTFVVSMLLVYLSQALFDVPLNGSIPALVLVLVVYILVTLCIGFLISVVSDKEINAFSAYNLFAQTPALLLSGSMFPVENLPTVVQPFSLVVPTTWCVQALRKLMIQGLDIASVTTELAVMSAMCLVLVLCSVHKLRKTL